MQATQFIRTLNEEGVIDPDWPTLKKDDFRAGWKQGKCGMMHENFAALSTKSNYKDFDENFPDGQWVVLVPPTGPNGDSVGWHSHPVRPHLCRFAESHRRRQGSGDRTPAGVDGQ